MMKKFALAMVVVGAVRRLPPVNTEYHAAQEVVPAAPGPASTVIAIAKRKALTVVLTARS